MGPILAKEGTETGMMMGQTPPFVGGNRGGTKAPRTNREERHRGSRTVRGKKLPGRHPLNQTRGSSTKKASH